MQYPAHIYLAPSGERYEQSVEAHCRSCAAYAADAAPVALQKTVYLAGLLHDMGKFTEAFRDYLNAAVVGEAVRRGSVNHTFAGVWFVMERWHTDREQSFQNLTAELIAFAIGAHHGQNAVPPAQAGTIRCATGLDHISVQRYSNMQEEYWNSLQDFSFWRLYHEDSYN